MKTLLFFLTFVGYSQVFDEFIKTEKEEEPLVTKIQTSVFGYYYLQAFFLHGSLQWTQPIDKLWQSEFWLGGGFDNQYTYWFGASLHYNTSPEKPWRNEVYGKLSGHIAKSESDKVEPVITLGLLREQAWNDNSGFRVYIEYGQRIGSGFRTRPSGFFNDVKLSNQYIAVGSGFYWSLKTNQPKDRHLENRF